MNVTNAVAEFERDLPIERIRAGLSRAKADGKRLGSPHEPDGGAARQRGATAGGGAGVTALARGLRTSRQITLRIRSAADGLVGPAHAGVLQTWQSASAK